MKRLLIYIFFVFSSTISLQSYGEVVAIDSTVHRGFDEQKLTEYNESPRYDYDRKIERKPNIILNIFAEIFSFFARVFGSIIGYIALILLVAGLIWVIVTNVRVPKKKVRVKEEDVLHYDPEQDIQAIDYSGLLEDALANQNYRLAIRYLYIITLQKLQMAELIQWHKEKTNRDYYYELPVDFQPVFNDVLRVYEYVWYGEFQASEELFRKMKNNIADIESKTGGVQ